MMVFTRSVLNFIVWMGEWADFSMIAHDQVY
jgi:hypothetical protein